jgi:hypothetical protein
MPIAKTLGANHPMCFADSLIILALSVTQPSKS